MSARLDALEARVALLEAAVAQPAVPAGTPDSIAAIVADVGRLLDLAPEAIIGRGRTAELVRARQAAAWAATVPPLSHGFAHVARALGRSDIATVIARTEAAHARRASEPAFARLTDRLLTAVKERMRA